jgi:hypothetical protein
MAQADVDAGEKPGLSSDERRELVGRQRVLAHVHVHAQGALRQLVDRQWHRRSLIKLVGAAGVRACDRSGVSRADDTTQSPNQPQQ